MGATSNPALRGRYPSRAVLRRLEAVKPESVWGYEPRRPRRTWIAVRESLWPRLVVRGGGGLEQEEVSEEEPSESEEGS